VRRTVDQSSAWCATAAKRFAAELDLRTRETALAGGENGPALPRLGARQLLYKKVLASDDRKRMPPNNRISDEQIAALKQWLDAAPPTGRAAEAENAPAPTGGHSSRCVGPACRKSEIRKIRNPEPIGRFIQAKSRRRDLSQVPRRTGGR